MTGLLTYCARIMTVTLPFFISLTDSREAKHPKSRDGSSLNCTFDDDFCYWVQDGSDNSDWTRHTGDASFIYIEKSYYSSGEEEIARLLSSKQSPGPFCLTFFYMFEIRFLGVLKVYMRIDGEGDNLIFTRDSAMESHGLRKAVISDFSDAAFQIVIEGVIDYGRLRGKISIDGITMTDRFCSVVSDCYFDSGLCYWMQDYNDDFDWTLHRDGHYIYINTSTANGNVTARLTSPYIEAGKHCFSFLYHMYGKDTCTIRINKAEQKKETTEIVVISGSQETKWKNRTIFIQSGTYFKVIIEGRVEDVLPFQGYIAIDNVEITSCQDCENPLTSNGRTNSSNFQYGSVVEIQCHSGYHLIGPTTLVCQSGGIWSANVTCKPIECKDPTPKNGKLNSTYFRHGSVVEITCSDGYKISGESVIYCNENGNWTSSPNCTHIDYLIPKIANRKMSGPRNNTTYNLDTAFEDGYDLVGNKSITCQIDGNWSASPLCDYRGTMDINTLTAVYVTVPLAAVALVIALIAVIWRKNVIRYLKVRSSHVRNVKEQPQPGNVFTNMTYSEHFYENQLNPEGYLSHNYAYAQIANGRHETGQGGNPEYAIIADAKITTIEEIEHIYNHTSQSGAPVFDSTYSHLTGDPSMSSSNYNTTAFPIYGSASFQFKTNPKNKTYDVLDTKVAKRGCRFDLRPNMQDEQDCEYDHVQARGTVPTYLSDYAYLNEGAGNSKPKRKYGWPDND